MRPYVLCCVGTKTIDESFLHEARAYLSANGARLGEHRELSRNGFRALDLHLEFPNPYEKIKAGLMDLSNRHHVDVALVPQDGWRDRTKLIVFDMDSTLIQHEVIDEMAAVYGIGEKVRAITERAMNGELNFDQSLRERVALLKGLKRSEMEAIYSKLKLTPGVETLIREVKKRGLKTAIVSGGFKYFAENFRARLGMDFAFANELEFSGDVLAGTVKGKIINAEEKARIIEELAGRENLALEQVVAVGDGANDLLMLAKAGFGIAFHAKEKVRNEARYVLGHGPMTTLLYFLGIPGDHFDEAP